MNLESLRDENGTFSAVNDESVGCPIPWLPNAFGPVFYGYEDYMAELVVDRQFAGTQSLPASFGPESQPALEPSLRPRPVAHVPTMRVLFPSIDLPPLGAQPLQPCGLYPLVVLAHGQCLEGVSQQDLEQQRGLYLDWAESPIATQLARAGYVVAVPQLSGDANSAVDQDILRQVVEWMRSDWIHRDILASTTGAIGHSRGGPKAALLTNEGGIDAFTDLSGAWDDAADPRLLLSIGVPQLHIHGTAEDDELTGLYEQAQTPKHRLVIKGATHFDYLPGAPCNGSDLGRGPCGCTPNIAADCVTMFFGRYLPPPGLPGLPDEISDFLRPPALVLGPERQAYAAGFFDGFWCLESDDHCVVELSFETGPTAQTETIPAGQSVYAP